MFTTDDMRRCVRFFDAVLGRCSGTYSFDQDSVGIAMTDDNTYLIKNGDQYEVYIDGVYIFKTDDLAPFKNVKIYNNSQEVDTND